MLISPPPHPPCPFLYSPGEFAVLQANHEEALQAWQRESDRAMWLNAIPVICACIGGIVAALFGPSIVLDAIAVLAQ